MIKSGKGVFNHQDAKDTKKLRITNWNNDVILTCADLDPELVSGSGLIIKRGICRIGGLKKKFKVKA